MSAHTYIPPTRGELSNLENLGTLAQVVSGLPQNLSMIQVVETLKMYNETILNATLGKYFQGAGVQASPIAVIYRMSEVFSNAPHDNSGAALTPVILSFLCLTWICVAMRVYARLFKAPKKLLIEDWCCLVALILLTSFCIVVCIETTYKWGSGVHIYDLSLERFLNFNRLGYAAAVLYSPTKLFTLMAFLTFYYRLSPIKWYRYSVVAAMVFTVILCAVGLFALAFQCTPVAYWELKNLLTAKCYNRLQAFMILGLLCLVVDLFCILIPIPIVMRLTLPPRQKYILIGLFALGLATCGSEALRVYYVDTWLITPDITYFHKNQGITAAVEHCVGICISCAPSIKILFFKTSLTDAAPGKSTMGWGQSGIFRKGIFGKGKDGARTERNVEPDSFVQSRQGETNINEKDKNADGEIKINSITSQVSSRE